jgi:predicted nucleic acid binding AN1-type Zn finger protein
MTLSDSTKSLFNDSSSFAKSSGPSAQYINRCCAADCRKKLKLTDMDCRCQKRFCAAHRLPETHACTFDHTAREWSALVNQLMSNQTENKKVPTI